MADVLALVLKRFSSQPEGFQFQRLSDYRSCMVVGECDDLKKSLLILAAITAASELGLKVLFLSPAPIQSLPAAVQNALAKLSPDSLKRIQFKYARSQDDLLNDVAVLHELTSVGASPPSLIVVDAMEHYVDAVTQGGLRSKQASAAHIAALLNDTAAFLTQKVEERGEAQSQCYVIVSFRSEQEAQTSVELSATDTILAVLDRYFPVRCTFARSESGSTSDPAAERRTVWQIYFSGVGVTTSCLSGTTDDSAAGHRWLLSFCENGVMEFCPHNE